MLRFLSRRVFVLGCIAWLLPTLSGCGDKGVGESVMGNVTLDEQPLEEGRILFSPLQEGQSAGGVIEGGRFHLPKERGPGAGRYQVQISAYRGTGRMIVDEVHGTEEADVVPIIPPRYNVRSELEVEIVGGVENTFDFALQSK